MSRRFQLVDVFHEQQFSGNPLAVILDAEGLSTEEMQRIARWLNLSETAFLLPPTARDADYRVRIFTLEREMPFAGHPTLGSCHAWLAAGGMPRSADEIVQECGVGLVRVRRQQGLLSFAAPPLIRSGPVDEPTLRTIETVLQLDRSRFVDVQWVDNGPGWVGVLLASAEEVLALDPLRQFPTRVDIGVVGPYPPGSPVAFELRTFFSDHKGGIVEDPVTGSFNASAAQWLLASGRARVPYVASQGTRLGRSGRVVIDQDGEGTVWVGGKTTTCFAGEYVL
ncbi:PhzF family phenazine biosynthesis protein [Thermomicrobiaceae bacterium CFH 74404]|uniref:PhzF family phenazine biosynthesis protein n=1 Tax=Thermalbibacter longus TaxID=2951981 RepID=A0AA42BAV6_9BACT|nr:PhzF family phenazine biosynthesis protein [Thermalbibacter longus]MCM8750271.1 PhzF family phenazine biosynthesis protein [Thermalbibacter longus]